MTHRFLRVSARSQKRENDKEAFSACLFYCFFFFAQVYVSFLFTWFLCLLTDYLEQCYGQVSAKVYGWVSFMKRTSGSNPDRILVTAN